MSVEYQCHSLASNGISKLILECVQTHFMQRIEDEAILHILCWEGSILNVIGNVALIDEIVKCQKIKKMH